MTLDDYGVTWDEPLYYQAGDAYINWFLNLLSNSPTPAGNSPPLEYYWYINAQHPPLVKVTAGITNSIFGFFLDPVSAYRISEILWFVLLLTLVYNISKVFAGVSAAWFAVITLAFLPRVFAHAHFVELDLPLAVVWLMTLYCFYRGMDSYRWSILTGICFGLALLTKVTALFLIIPLLMWAQWIKKKQYTNNLFSMLFIGIPIFIIGWPWLWHHTFGRIIDYYQLFFNFKSPLKTFYFGHAYADTPWHYPFILTLLTIPILILSLATYGIFKGLKIPDNKSFTSLLLINISFLLLLFAIPGTLVIDGVRYFLSVFPLIVILAGFGFSSLIQLSKGRNLEAQPLLILGTILLVNIPSFYWTYALHPAQLSFYNILIGGPRFAEAVGMETTYWGEVLGPQERYWMNKNLPSNAKIKILPVYPANTTLAALSFYPDVVVFYQQQGYLWKELQFFANPPYDYFVLISRQGLFDDFCWHLYLKEKPIYSRKLGTLQVLGIYRNPLRDSLNYTILEGR